ncbi:MULTISPECIES: hypothetical protein [Bacillaceae]|uniref:hypothetical protein n=1 Tax=Bacillaceae TaxID=186817 RepID=UPI000A709874|nr:MULTISPECIES: hypothetical protein [Bacillaceae]UOE93538.1 hypothetical protein MM271_20490 [Alkalihalobacillus sp. LMS39]
MELKVAMTNSHFIEELLVEFQSKLHRDLTEKEKEFVHWIHERRLEDMYKRMKSS